MLKLLSDSAAVRPVAKGGLLMASRGFTESIILSHFKKIALQSQIFSIILGNILFLTRTYKRQLLVFVFVLFWGEMILLGTVRYLCLRGGR